ncbi:DUF1592 domain-containing protein [Stieleria sp. TO1_6]|uniref:DUF1592 domain-containing protein n=1 Tax=Stieleria tagensis TaxID=2956795 RepID=UPI00209BB646|nr:DUF1592 domain-containing protein [Stieleria tagensis]MCO8121794.1 DUF1592 domain-containing protein [Stieleria tagensis]
MSVKLARRMGHADLSFVFIGTQVLRSAPRAFVLLLAVALACLHGPANLAPAEQVAGAPVESLAQRRAELQQQYQSQIAPLVTSHCAVCHDATAMEAGLDLTVFPNLDSVAQSHVIWQTMLDRIKAGEMPPEDAEELDANQRDQLVEWIGDFLALEGQQNSGDPGPVLARRLSNAEYDNTIRDLTGADIRPTQTFPIDPANEAGFDNSGESLTMSPALMNKYLEAARAVVDHLVLTPDGIRFASHPVMTDTDRDKYCVNRIVEFYRRQPTDYADYLMAAWTLHSQRSASESPPVVLDEQIKAVADQYAISGRYLATVWDALHRPTGSGPLGELQARWQPLAAENNDQAARTSSQQIADWIVTERKRFEPEFKNLNIDGVHKGTQAFVLWKNDQYANHRQRPARETLQRERSEDANATDDTNWERYRLDCEQFCAVFPDAFYIAERGRDYLGKSRDQQEKGRLLSAGFHSMMGYYRDDQPLQELILDEAGRSELDALWQELDFIASAPQRQYQGFLWFDRTDSRFMREPQFDFARPEDEASLTEPMIQRLAEVYLAKAERSGGTGVAMQAIADYFSNINQQIRWVERTRESSQPVQVDAVIEFAQRAYRRPLNDSERAEIREFYQSLREVDQLSHHEAIEDCVLAILMSPHFCYRVDLLSDSDQTRALTDVELASRLSYFLWSSMPDQELMRLATAGQLSQPDELKRQTERMLRDPRSRGLAVEFGGNWLDFRRFKQHNSVDRTRFPSFDDSLRSAMFEEPVRFLVDLIQQDRSVLDCLYAKRTFVNAPLARHYGMPDSPPGESEWWPVTDADEFGRGGLLSMAVFQTQNAPGLRTSPVKRGYWVVRRLLGERIPPPPPDVPELPSDESQLGDLTLRETLARHRDHASCAGCHDRFDAIGLAFEGFGPVGELRELDLGGRPVDTSAVFPDGQQRTGVSGLKQYLRANRESDFIANLSRKLLSYALGRSLQLSDQSLLDEMKQNAQRDDYRFRSLVDTVVNSPQFLRKRGRHPANLVRD